MTELALLLPSLILGYLLWQERRDQREREKEWTLERGALLNRIQVPEAAPWMGDEGPPIKAYVTYDDDADFYAAKDDEANMNGADG